MCQIALDKLYRTISFIFVFPKNKNAPESGLLVFVDYKTLPNF